MTQQAAIQKGHYAQVLASRNSLPQARNPRSRTGPILQSGIGSGIQQPMAKELMNSLVSPQLFNAIKNYMPNAIAMADNVRKDMLRRESNQANFMRLRGNGL